MNRKKIITISYKLLRAAMLLFWLYAGLDKIWQLGAFQIALQQQPVISFMAPLLFWLLPLLEIGLAVLLALPAYQLQRWGWWGSIVLISLFSVYIGLGVLDVYAQKPCMCTSFLSQISWNTHLLVNLLILGLSILGLLLGDRCRNIKLEAPADTTVIKLSVIAFLLLGAYQYKSTFHAGTQTLWDLPDSMEYYQEQENVSRPIVGSLAHRIGSIRRTVPTINIYKRYAEWQGITRLPVCSTERRIALC